MPLSKEDVHEACKRVTKGERLYVTMKQSMKLGVGAAIGATVGAAFLGPVGAIAGSSFGAAAGTYWAGKYETVYAILMDLTEEQQEELQERIDSLLKRFAITSLVSFMAEARKKGQFHQELTKLLPVILSEIVHAHSKK